MDPLEPVLRQLIGDWPEIRAPRVTEILRDDDDYQGSVDLVRKRLALLRPQTGRPAQKTGYRPGQVLQVDWAEMPTRPRIAVRSRSGFRGGGYWGAAILVAVRSDCVAGALAEWCAAVVGEVPLEVAALQAARLILSDSTRPPPIGGSRPSSR